MHAWFLSRLLWMIPVLLTVSAVTFLLMHLAPGGPWDSADPERKALPPHLVTQLERQFLLDRPLWEQYANYVANALRGDLGPSLSYTDQRVTDVIFAPPRNKPFWESRFLRSLLLGSMAFVLMVVVGIPLGVRAAQRRGSWIDHVSLNVTLLGVGIPGFVMAVLALLVFGVWLKWTPVAARNWDEPRVWLVPTVVLSLGGIALVTRLTRATMLDALRQDYVRTARAKGVRERDVLRQHALRNALLPIITVLGPTLAFLITGSFFIETIFAFPGTGRLLVDAVNQRDYPLIMGTTLMYAVIICMVNLVVDVLYGWLDPRIKVN